jgi:ribosome-binding factor A
MAREFSRTDRISDQIQKDLASLIRTEMKDPRVGMVTINDVNVARDLGYADVYITLLTLEENDANSDSVKQCLAALNSAAGFLRSQLGKMIKLRTIPRLRFHYDSSVGHGRKLDALITQARKKDGDSATEESGDS